MSLQSSFSPLKISSVCAAALLAGLPIASALETAGTLLIDLDANTLNAGVAGSWNNSGSLGSAFVPTGAPTVTQLDGAKAVVFDGTAEFMVGPSPSGTSVVGNDPNRTVELWIYNGHAQSEEWAFNFGRRADYEGAKASVGYGTNTAWGAIAHWGPQDMGFEPFRDNGQDTTGNVPQTGRWHHFVYTYDGRSDDTVATPTYNTRLYVDGQLVNSEQLESGRINTFADAAFSLATPSIRNQDGSSSMDSGNLNIQFSGALAKVRVHTGVLSAAQVEANYDEEKVNFNLGTTEMVSRGPVNRYDFSNNIGVIEGGDDDSSRVVVDLVGGANGVVRGANAFSTGSGVDLPGGASGSEAYIDLPNGIISSHIDITLESWLTIEGGNTWARVMDFGTNQAGEVFGPGGDFQGTNYLTLTAFMGGDARQALERVGGQAGEGRNSGIISQINEQVHMVLTYDSVAGEWRYYRQGSLIHVLADPGGLASIPDVNNWLGRSNWSGDGNLNGTFDEFRVYDYALNESQIRGNFLTGPDLVNIPEPTSVSLLALGGLLCAGLRRRKA